MRKLLQSSGQIALGLPIVITLIGSAVTFVGSMYGAQLATVNEISADRQRISVVETKSDHYEKDIELINKKLDALIEAQNIKLK
jgi:hypothetical protein